MNIQLNSFDLLTLLGPKASEEILKNLEHCLVEVMGSEGLMKKVDHDINTKLKKVIDESIKASITTEVSRGRPELKGWAAPLLVKEMQTQLAGMNMLDVIRKACEIEMKSYMKTVMEPKVEKILNDAIEENIKALCRSEYKDQVRKEFEAETLEPMIRRVLRHIMTSTD